jgi:hypothetical protein
MIIWPTGKSMCSCKRPAAQGLSSWYAPPFSVLSKHTFAPNAMISVPLLHATHQLRYVKWRWIKLFTRTSEGKALTISDEVFCAFFPEHSIHFFPGLCQVHRSTFVRQSANLWATKERVWMLARDELIRHEIGGDR